MTWEDILDVLREQRCRDHSIGPDFVEVRMYNHRCTAFIPPNVNTDYPFVVGFGLSYFFIMLVCVCVSVIFIFQSTKLFFLNHLERRML